MRLRVEAGRGVPSLYVLAALLILGATLSPAVAQDFVDKPDFTDVSDLTLVSDAAQVGGEVRLTDEVTYEVGAVWFNTPVSLENGFVTTFTYRIEEPQFPSEEPVCVNRPGDGIAFVMQSNDLEAIGGSGIGIGYGTGEGVDGIPNSLVVEIDTWHNTVEFMEPDGNHIAVQSMGTDPNLSSPVATLALASPASSLRGSERTVTITYAAGQIEVQLDGQTELEAAVDIDALGIYDDNDEIYVGFTAGTGLCYQPQYIVSWTFAGVPPLFSSGFEDPSLADWSRAVP